MKKMILLILLTFAFSPVFSQEESTNLIAEEETASSDAEILTETDLSENPYGDDRIMGSISWEHSVAFGFFYSLGNANLLNLDGSFSLNRNRLWIDEWDLDFAFDVRQTNRIQSYREIDASLRYGRSFTYKFYGFVSADVENDLAGDIAYKLLPTAGVGYWITDSDTVQLMAEIGAGYKYTRRIISTNSQMPVTYLSGLLSWDFLTDFNFSEEFELRPSIDFSIYLFDSVTTLSYQITDDLSLVFEYDLDVNTAPAPGVLKYDHAFHTDLEWGE